MKIERKDLLLVLALIMFAFISVPGVLFNQAIKKYLSLLNIWSEKPMQSIKPSQGKIPPARNHYSRADLKEPELKIITFSIKLKSAAEVSLSGDFNKWSRIETKLVKRQNGAWETILALPPGKYKYVFFVDGERTLDPYNPSIAELDGQKTSIIEVK
ncbi:MAG: hypothetical protein Fur0012_02470 [Elusimicrobiota bacterium]